VGENHVFNGHREGKKQEKILVPVHFWVANLPSDGSSGDWNSFAQFRNFGYGHAHLRVWLKCNYVYYEYFTRANCLIG
jgi:hypothetical protein